MPCYIPKRKFDSFIPYYQGDIGLRGPVGETGLPGVKGMKGEQGYAKTIIRIM